MRILITEKKEIVPVLEQLGAQVVWEKRVHERLTYRERMLIVNQMDELQTVIKLLETATDDDIVITSANTTGDFPEHDLSIFFLGECL